MRRLVLAWAMITLLLLGVTGCQRLVGATIYGTITEGGLKAGVDFPGGTITVSKQGHVVDTLSLSRGQSEWKYSCQPGTYQVTIDSDGRRTENTVDVRSGSAALTSNFSEVLIYGEVRFGAEPKPSSRVELHLSKDGAVIQRVSLLESNSFRFVVAPGPYGLKVVKEGQEANFSINASLSCSRILDLARTSVIKAEIREAGNLLGDFPGGVVCIQNLSGQIVDRRDITPGQSEYEIPVKPGIYRVVAESAGRTVESECLDLSEESTMFCTLNFKTVVLFGNVKTDAAIAPEATLNLIQNGNVVKSCRLSSDDKTYSITLSPGQYDAEVRVPSTGGLVKDLVNLGLRSRSLDLDLLRKVTITGSVTENSCTPDPDCFPAGEVELRTDDGVTRSIVPLNRNGTFAAEVYAGKYLLRAVSKGRLEQATIDACKSNQAVHLDYTDIVFVGTLKMGESALPASFPRTSIDMVDGNGKSVHAGIVGAGRTSFEVVVPSGSYSIRLRVAGTAVEALFPVPHILAQSVCDDIDIQRQLSRIRGRVAAKTGVPSCEVVVKLLLNHVETPYMAVKCSSAYEYDLYCIPGTYDLQIEGSKYVTRRYDDIYIGEGESTRDLEFTQCVVTYRFTLITGLFNTPALFNVCVNDWCYKVGDNPDNIVQRFVYPRGAIPAYAKVQWEVPVTLDIGTTYYMLVFGIDVGSVTKWTITPTEGQTVEMAVPLMLGS